MNHSALVMGYWLAAAVERNATDAASGEEPPPPIPMKERDALAPDSICREGASSNNNSLPENGLRQAPPTLPQ
ncbi:hypothetical protein POL68_23730 [Stigmatella sp. ncwal1]|uniref:Uncharacterized protein n=1 Tax=Stigmatella ashevillensis TaxID=2995309 RepID=A0ABT5DCW4_9BACT|nr:hypothetical protein [Stigmatella ashevillena]MDC0711502.1 hypothetical protein [Stigmatella ashevillena]